MTRQAIGVFALAWSVMSASGVCCDAAIIHAGPGRLRSGLVNDPSSPNVLASMGTTMPEAGRGP